MRRSTNVMIGTEKVIDVTDYWFFHPESGLAEFFLAKAQREAYINVRL
ncbi:MAG: hypothetical protein IPO03_01265 [Bacteroidetes bacterium]|nr:hypothetical protein [Bacteroidota bacterium]